MGLGLRFMDACMGFRDVGFRGFGVCVCDWCLAASFWPSVHPVEQLCFLSKSEASILRASFAFVS